MAAIRISQLAEVTSVTNDDVFVINDGDVNTRKITYTNLTAGLVPKVGTTTIDGGLTLTGALTSQDLLVDGGTLFVDSTNDRVGIGTQSPTEALEVSGNLLLRGNNQLRLNDPNNAYAISLQTPVLSASNTYALPNSFPSISGQVLSSTDAGVMSWESVFVDPMATVGDMVVRNVGNVTARLPIGLLGQVLTVQGDGTANWQNPVAPTLQAVTDSGNSTTNDVSFGAATFSSGKIGLYADGSGSFYKTNTGTEDLLALYNGTSPTKVITFACNGSGTFESTIRSNEGVSVYPPTNDTYSFATRNAADDAWTAFIKGDGSAVFSRSVTAGSHIESSGAGVGFILASPNGTRYRITVDNSGNLSTAAV